MRLYQVIVNTKFHEYNYSQDKTMKISILQILLQTVPGLQFYIIKNLLPRVVAICLYLLVITIRFHGKNQ